MPYQPGDTVLVRKPAATTSCRGAWIDQHMDRFDGTVMAVSSVQPYPYQKGHDTIDLVGSGYAFCECWLTPAGTTAPVAPKKVSHSYTRLPSGVYALTGDLAEPAPARPAPACLSKNALRELLYDVQRATPTRQAELIHDFCERFGLE